MYHYFVCGPGNISWHNPSLLESKDATHTCHTILHWYLVQWCAAVAPAVTTAGTAQCFLHTAWCALNYCTLVCIATWYCGMKKINVLRAVVPYLIQALPGLQPYTRGSLLLGMRIQLKGISYLQNCSFPPTQVFVLLICKPVWLRGNQSSDSKEVPVCLMRKVGKAWGCGWKKNVWYDPCDNYLCFGGEHWKDGACWGRQVSSVS